MSAGRYYGAIAVQRGFSLRVERAEYRGRPRLDVRLFAEMRPGDPDTGRPTPKGISLPLHHLPRLRQLIEEAEAEALEAGLLRPHHYRSAGVDPPATLGGAP